LIASGGAVMTFPAGCKITAQEGVYVGDEWIGGDGLPVEAVDGCPTLIFKEPKAIKITVNK